MLFLRGCWFVHFYRFCAREYEKRKDMVFTALAYKCMEVAYFKVAFYKNYIASKDYQELQATIQAFSQG